MPNAREIAKLAKQAVKEQEKKAQLEKKKIEEEQRKWEEGKPYRIKLACDACMQEIDKAAREGKFSIEYNATIYPEIANLLRKEGFKVEDKVTSEEELEMVPDSDGYRFERTGHYYSKHTLVINW